MTTPTSVICYRNWVAEAGRVLSGSTQFEVEAPLSNALTSRPGQLAIAADGSTSEVTFSFEIGANGSSSNAIGRPVGIVALVNTNIVASPSEASGIVVTLTDSNGGTVTCAASQIQRNGSGEVMQTIVFDVGTDGTGAGDLSDVGIVSFSANGQFGSRDPWTGVVTEAPFHVGTVLAGPAWRPSRGIRLLGSGPSVQDSSPRIRSIGDTLWASPQMRVRAYQFELSLSESEIEAVPPSCGLRQLAEWCGLSRPLLVVPHQQSDAYAASQTLYGYLEDVPVWPSVDRSNAGIEHRVALSVRESK